jgi:hypothetical protein
MCASLYYLSAQVRSSRYNPEDYEENDIEDDERAMQLLVGEEGETIFIPTTGGQSPPSPPSPPPNQQVQ